MFEFIVGFLLAWPTLVILFLLGTIFEFKESNGCALFTGLILAVISYFYFSIPFILIMKWSILYLVIGILWSIWRYKRHADKIVEKYKNESDYNKKDALRYLRPSEMLSKITSWILVWPFSMLENVIGDLIKFVETLVLKVFKNVYNRIYDAAVKRLIDG